MGDSGPSAQVLWTLCGWDSPRGRRLLRRVCRVFDRYCGGHEMSRQAFHKMCVDASWASSRDARTARVAEIYDRALAERGEESCVADFIDFVHMLEIVAKEVVTPRIAAERGVGAATPWSLRRPCASRARARAAGCAGGCARSGQGARARMGGGKARGRVQPQRVGGRRAAGLRARMQTRQRRAGRARAGERASKQCMGTRAAGGARAGGQADGAGTAREVGGAWALGRATRTARARAGPSVGLTRASGSLISGGQDICGRLAS